MKWLEPDARKEMESALAVHKHIDLVYAHNDPGAHGAYLAAKAVGRDKEMLFIGIDGLPQEGQIYVRQGILAASFEYPTGGKEAIDTALRILKGEKVAKEITLRSRVFTPENIMRGGDWLNPPGSTAPDHSELSETPSELAFSHSFLSPGRTPPGPGMARRTGIRSAAGGNGGKSVYGSAWYQ